MARQDGYFIVDGLFFTDLPVAFSPLTDDEFGVADTVYKTADGQKIVAVQSPQVLDYGDYRDYYHRRKVPVQAWRADWGEESLMTVFMMEKLLALYESQKRFWIQYDDEMARCWGRLVGLNADLTDGNRPHVYFTPHYPIFPFGHEPPADPEAAGAWDGMFMVGQTLWDSSEYTVYPDYGMVVVEPGGRRFHDRVKAHLKYTWRGYVRVKEVQFEPFKLAQTYYVGTVVFEQVPVPISGVALEWRDPPYVGICTYYDRVRTSTQAKVAVVGSVVGTRFAHVVSPSAAVGSVRVRNFVVAGKNSVPYKYGSTLVSPVVIGTIGSGVSGSSVPAGSTNGGAISESGTGWARSLSSKTASQIISDKDPTTYIYGSTYSQRFKLTSFATPLVNTGHILNVDWRRATEVSTSLTVRLFQGAMLIASPTFVRGTDGDAQDTYTLSGAEADLITDYSDLYVEFYSDYQAVVPQFEIEVPTPTAGIKMRSVTGNIAVTALAKATRPPIIGYPVASTVVVRSTVAGTRYTDQGEPDLPN